MLKFHRNLRLCAGYDGLKIQPSRNRKCEEFMGHEIKPTWKGKGCMIDKNEYAQKYEIAEED